MKRMLILPLCLLLLCGGCGKKSGAAADIQAQYSRIHTAQMEAEVTFHTPELHPAVRLYAGKLHRDRHRAGDGGGGIGHGIRRRADHRL